MDRFLVRWLFSRTVRQAWDMCRQVRRIIKAQRDLLSAEAIGEVTKAAAELKAKMAGRCNVAAIRQGMDNLEKVANQRLRPYPNPGWRENVEVLLVTGAVVLALRTFFFQPMTIPTGSAQPTLWGITHENLKGMPGAEIPSGLRRFVERWWSGVRYYHVKAKAGGVLRRVEQPKNVMPFVKKQVIQVGDRSYTILFAPADLKDRAGLEEGQVFRKGEDIIKLRVKSGDYLFVDRLTYNFRRPRRGEIIVFESTGIPLITQNTHYIKRLIALSGERVRIGNDRHVIVNGQRLDASKPGFENVYGFDPKEPPRPDQYSGHANVGKFPDENSEFTVRPNHYLAFGDNTMNSHDGRSWGDFPREKVIGKAGFVFWPISQRFGWGFR